MYIALSIISGILTIYVLWAFISPKTAFFFVKDKAKRKRFPIAVIALVLLILFEWAISDIMEATPERQREREEARIEAEQKAEIERVKAEKATRDSILRVSIDALNEREQAGQILTTGPSDTNWRNEQRIYAQRDSLNLAWVSSTLDNRFSIKEGSSDYNTIVTIIKTGVKPYWQQQAHRQYYENPAKYGDPVITDDGYNIQRLIDTNNKEAIRLNQKFIGMVK